MRFLAYVGKLSVLNGVTQASVPLSVPGAFPSFACVGCWPTCSLRSHRPPLREEFSLWGHMLHICRDWIGARWEGVALRELNGNRRRTLWTHSHIRKVIWTRLGRVFVHDATEQLVANSPSPEGEPLGEKGNLRPARQDCVRIPHCF